MDAVCEIITFCCENHTKYINRLCGQNTEFQNDKVGGTQGYHCPLKG
jgi:hypothetical protein